MSTTSTNDRLARLAARSAAHRRELGAPFALPAPPTAAPPTAAGPVPPAPPRVGTPPPPPPPAPPNGARTGGNGPAPRRRHAAKGSRTAALAVSVGTTAGLVGWFAAQTHSAATSATLTPAADQLSTAAAGTTASAGATASAATTATSTGASTAVSGTAAAGSSASATTAASAATTSSSALTDGSYTGAVETNRWGPVQVQITVAGGTITAVDVLQVPSSNPKDQAINARAVPVLVQETLSAQSAEIDTVSGATYTSDSYKQSLQSAIDAARSGATTTAAAAG